MPRQYTDEELGKLPATLRLILVADAMVTGVGYLIGPSAWSSSTTLNVVRSLGVPFPIWGAAFIVGGIVLAFGVRIVPHFGGHAILALLYGFWGLATAATIFTSELSAWGGPWHVLCLAGMHGYALYRRNVADIRLGR